jgi:hypothetical protein
VYSCTQWRRPRNSPPPLAFGLIYEGAIGQPRLTTSLCDPPLGTTVDRHSQEQIHLVSTVHCKENPIYVFLFWELHVLSPNFHIHVSVCEQSIYSQDRSTYFLRKNRQIHRRNIEIAHSHIDVEIGTVTAQIVFWEYLFKIFGIVS